MPHGTAWNALVVPTLAALALAASGCGDDGDPTDSAAGSPAAFAERVAHLVTNARDFDACEPVHEIAWRSPIDIPCPAPQRLRRTLAGFEHAETRRYGSAAVVSYGRRDGRTADMVLARGNDGGWAVVRLAHRTGGPHGAASDAQRPGRASRIVREWLAAPDIDDDALSASLGATSEAEPRHLGGHPGYAFFELTTREPVPRYYTLAVLSPPSGASRVRRPSVEAVLGPVERAVEVLSREHRASSPADHVVRVTASGFKPARLRIYAGDRVTFVNRGGGTHAVRHDPRGVIDPTPEPGPTDHSGNDVNRATAVGFRTHSLFGNEPQTVAFTAIRSYRYHCAFHEGLTGTVEVLPRRRPRP